MARSLFWGGLLLGLIVLLPVPLSYFLSVRYTYFLGWGMFVFLGAMVYELIQIQAKDRQTEVARLEHDLNQYRTQTRFLASEWKKRLGKATQDTVAPGDEKTLDSSLIQVRCGGSPERWLPLVGRVAAQRFAVLVEWREGVGLWALDAWSETALAFALEVQKQMASCPDLDYTILLTRAVVRYQILEAETHWIPVALGVPTHRLDELAHRAVVSGARVVLDASLRDGLAVGGWRRHRPLTVSGSESEFYEADDPARAAQKDRTVGRYEAVLELWRSGRRDQAVGALEALVQENPGDSVFRAIRAEWGAKPGS